MVHGSCSWIVFDDLFKFWMIDLLYPSMGLSQLVAKSPSCSFRSSLLIVSGNLSLCLLTADILEELIPKSMEHFPVPPSRKKRIVKA